MQKWLNYRKGRKLTTDDIIHFERMSYCISHTLTLMDEIDKLDEHSKTDMP